MLSLKSDNKANYEEENEARRKEETGEVFVFADTRQTCT
jgi:hypothetical protein